MSSANSPGLSGSIATASKSKSPLEKLKHNDIIIVHTGETIPVDGEIVDGMAMIDQHALTGESAPAEKIKGDKVFAATTMLAGKIQVAVTSTGSETTSAKLTRILNDTAGYKLRSQSHGEELADKAVVPTLALASLGLGHDRSELRHRHRQLRPGNRDPHGRAPRHADFVNPLRAARHSRQGRTGAGIDAEGRYLPL